MVTDLLPLTHSWPLFERAQRFDLGILHPVSTSSEALPFESGALDPDMLDRHAIGGWACDLATNRLGWSAGVYDLFGLPRDAVPTRDETVALYCERSRAAMERLRAYAIRHRRGLTLDAEIRPAQGSSRWMRLIAAPVCEGDRVVRLHGLKRDVTSDYR